MPSTRETLVSVAGTLLEEGGPAAVTLREVGRRSGLSHNAAHKLFGSKQQLLAAVSARGLTELAETLDRLDEAATTTRSRLIEHLTSAQRAGRLPPGDPERLAALLRSCARGAAHLTLVKHLAPDGNDGAGPDGLLDDLFDALTASGRLVETPPVR